MTYNKEDIDKIRSLILNDDIANVKLGIILAINTLGMSIDELGMLITKDDVTSEVSKFSGKRHYVLKAFGKNMADTYVNDYEFIFRYYLKRYKERIKELGYEI